MSQEESNTTPYRNEVPVEEWHNDWEKQNIPFHSQSVHKYLQEYYNIFVHNSTSRIFVPLCGKSVDILWLADKGNEVVGLEFSEIAIKDFFKESNLEFIIDSPDNFKYKVFKAKEKNITIYQGDMFNFNETVAGMFDSVWDRGSLVAIDMPNRKKYANIMSKILKPNGSILAECMMYDGSKYAGPPHFVTKESLEENYGSFCNMEHLIRTEHRKTFFGLDILYRDMWVLKKNK